MAPLQLLFCLSIRILILYAEQRLAARRAARAEAREIRMRELERQQREQEDHADKAYDMYAGKTPETVGRRPRLAALSPAVHSPRRSSEDSADDGFSIKDLRHELKEVEEKFRKAMILNAQLDNDKAALGYQLELLKDRIEELHEEYAQLQREHKEKCSAFERLRREHESVVASLTLARDAVRARDAAAASAGFAFIDAAALEPAARGNAGEAMGDVPALALEVWQSKQLHGRFFGALHGPDVDFKASVSWLRFSDLFGETEGFVCAIMDEVILTNNYRRNIMKDGTVDIFRACHHPDVRLQKLVSSKQALESEVRKLKLQLNEERAARQNGVANHHDQEYENELETVRKSVAEAKGRAARAEAEAALQAAHVARLEAQLARLRARQDHQDEHEDQLKQERRRLQREAREALNRVEELETENSHLTKRLDKLKNAKSALLKDL
ncbi:hypothetical protein B5X24_HaOG212524 [Helicoverpa armigera]|nr:hypothetical protein B5X24_HaOG212524 [Helicoverpa armigera]